MPPPSSILYENAARTVVVVDVPRSIEEAQGPVDETGPGQGVGRRRRILSTVPPSEPFPVPPGSHDEDATGHADLATQLAELTTAAAVTSALDELRGPGGFRGPWCLPRCCVSSESAPASPPTSTIPSVPSSSIPTPLGAHVLAGTIAACRDRFLAEAPRFNLIVLDPPWPNRSARRRWQGRKRRAAAEQASPVKETSTADTGYTTASGMAAVRALLDQIPVAAKLADDNDAALVAVWVTNKPAYAALLTDSKHGLFRAWGVELVATWTWLKVTTAGEPVVPVDAPWRKPWERLLLARRRPCSSSSSSTQTRRRPPPLPPNRVIVGVPDVHSRKPNLRPLLAPFLATKGGGGGNDAAVGLEVFARHLTAGWWAWGDEVLLFQQAAWWVAEDGQGEEAASDIDEDASGGSYPPTKRPRTGSAAVS